MFYYLSLGSNQGDRAMYINAACQAIEERCGRIVRRSSDYYSAPWGYESDKEYLNIALALISDLAPMELLHATQGIERDLGRTTKSRTSMQEEPVYQDRPIDIDLIEAYECDPREADATSITIDSEELVLPHPKMNERPFVREPMKEIR